MTDFLKLCDDCKRSQLAHHSEHEGGNAPELCDTCSQVFRTPPRPTFTYGLTPDALIKLAALAQCPDGFPLCIRSQGEWKALSYAWNQGIDAHLEALTKRSSADSSTGQVNVHPEELHTLLRRLYESGSDEAWNLRGSIVFALGIDEV